jgi:glycosyltransferase involved in cell wall biosynthesis
MRIAIIATPWTPVPPAGYGGIERVVDLLAKGVQNAGHEVLLFATGDSTCPVPTKWALEEAEHERIGMAVPELRHVIHAYEAAKEYDIVHDHTIMGPVYSQRFPDLPVVTTIHGPFNEELIDVYQSIADRVPIITISHAQGRAAPHIPVAKVIHHGLDVSEFPMGTGEGDYCLFLGRMTDVKGAHRATEAAHRAGVPLILAAKMRESWEKQYYQSHVEPYLNQRMEFVGEVEGKEKLDLLGNARCLLMPIRWNEPFGMVMIEALACGTPVLAYAEGAAPEIVEEGKTGFLCDNEEELAQAISKVDQIDRNACRAAVEGYFSAERMVAEHIELFEEVLAR